MPRKSINEIPEEIKAIVDNLNVEDFISAIEGHPAIWDSSIPPSINQNELFGTKNF